MAENQFVFSRLSTNQGLLAEQAARPSSPKIVQSCCNKDTSVGYQTCFLLPLLSYRILGNILSRGLGLRYYSCDSNRQEDQRSRMKVNSSLLSICLVRQGIVIRGMRCQCNLQTQSSYLFPGAEAEAVSKLHSSFGEIELRKTVQQGRNSQGANPCDLLHFLAMKRDNRRGRMMTAKPLKTLAKPRKNREKEK